MKYPIEPSMESLLLELKKRALRELVLDEAAYEELVDDMLDEKLEWGELNDQEDYIGIREDLIGRWPDVLEYVNSHETKRP